MKRADITDVMVCRACDGPYGQNSLGRLMAATGAPEKLCLAAMERAVRRDLIEYGTTIYRAWLTGSGTALLYRADHPAVFA